MNKKSLYNQFFISAAVKLPKDRPTGLGPKVSAAIELKELESFKPNHDPRTENIFLFFYFMNKEQATSDRVQAKRGALINFFYS